MTARPLFTLGPRLAQCAALVRPGRSLVDIGTDHAYLPIWLLKTGRIPCAVASDVNRGPLDAARRHAALYGVGEELRLVCSDGLRELSPEDGDEIVIAGMGGELILRMVSETPWLCCPQKRLVLQSMTQAEKLRAGLAGLGFGVTEERAVEENGKVYSVFTACYGEKPETDLLYPYMGRLDPADPAAGRYAAKVLADLANRLRGAEHSGDREQARALEEAIEGIEEIYILP